MSKNPNLKTAVYLMLLIIPITLACVLTVNYFILAWSEPSGPPPNGSITQDLNVNSHKIVNLTAPTNDSDAATKKYVTDTVAAAGGGVQFMGVTSTSYTGSQGGLDGANAKCAANFAGSHLCSAEEWLRSGSTVAPTASCWVSSAVNLLNNNADQYFGGCDGWDNNGTSLLGVYINTNGALRGDYCIALYRDCCCK